MRVIDLDQQISVPVVDETHGGATYEMQMTVGEFLDKFCEGFKPVVVEAVPVEWILNKVGDEEKYTLHFRHPWATLISLWEKEQEAKA